MRRSGGRPGAVEKNPGGEAPRSSRSSTLPTFRQAPRHFGQGWACRHFAWFGESESYEKELRPIGSGRYAKTLRGQKGGSPGSPLGQGMRLIANGRTPNRAGNDSLIAPPVARVVLPCSVNERLSSDWGADFPLTR